MYSSSSDDFQTAPRCDATIAICTYNRRATLPRTLAALRHLRGPHTFEVIVVNGPSTDGTTAFLETQDDIRVFSNPRINLSVSRNIAISHAAGDHIAFIDDDAVPEADWLGAILTAFDENPDVSAIGGFIRDNTGITFQAKYVFANAFGEGFPCENEDGIGFIRDEQNLYPSLTGTNVAFKTDHLRRIGGFDEAFEYFLDETDVNKRMFDAGMKAMVLPEAEIHHKFAASHLRTEANVSRNMRPIAKSIAYFALKHGVGERGWTPAIEHIQNFYSKELRWKHDVHRKGHIRKDDFVALMAQTQGGIADGIDLFFSDATAKDGKDFVPKHAEQTAPAIIRDMRRADDTLRLCMLSQDHHSTTCGGIGQWTRLVARGLAERGHEVTVIGETESATSPERCDLTEDRFWSHVVRAGTPPAPDTDCLGLPKSLAKSALRKQQEYQRLMPRRQFQAVSSPIWDVEGAALFGANTQGHVLSLHTCAGLMLDYKPEWRTNEAYYRNHVLPVIGAEMQAIKRARMILANSEAVMADIGAIYDIDLKARPHEVVPHGLEDIVDPHDLLERREAAFAAGVKPLEVLFLGRLETRKGIADVVPVMHQILDAHSNVSLTIVGSRAEEASARLVDQLVEAHPGRAQYLGFLTESELDAVMRRADVLFCPSLYESFGLIYTEAMRYSVPSVAFATGGVSEVITHDHDGLLAPLGDRGALHSALQRMVECGATRRRLSLASRQSFEQKYHYAKMAERLEGLYREVAGIGDTQALRPADPLPHPVALSA